MDIRGDPRRLQLLGSRSDGRHHRPQLDLDEASFATACQNVRTNKELCPYGCNKVLAPRTIDYHRLNGCRGKQDDAFADVSRKRSFTCGACYEEFVTRDAFFQHLNADHAVEATMHSLAFPDEPTFQRFRYWLEAQGGAHFRQKSGAKTRPSGKGIFMMCNRSGLVHTTAATGEPEKDKIGSYRMGYTCTAFINGTIYPDGHVAVRFCGDHYGHDARVRLPQSVKNIIMHMQSISTPNAHIIRYLQDHFMPFGHSSIHAQRAAYVDMEEIRSITPMLRRIERIPFEKEEEWEQEFLETAGIIRDWAPPPRRRPADWMPIKEYAEKMHWPHPLNFKAKLRNGNGEWMVFDDERQIYMLEGERDPRIKAQDFLDELDLEYEEKEDGREMEGGEGEEEEEEGEVDVEGLRESKQEEMGDSVASTSSVARSANKKRRLEEAVDEREGEGRMEDEEVEEDEERMEHESAEGANGRNYARSAFLTSSIVAELEMIKALVKNESEFLSEAELGEYLKRARGLRLAFEPIPRGARRDSGQRDFAVPLLARNSRAFPVRSRFPRVHQQQQQHRTGMEMRRDAEMRSVYGGGGGWMSSPSMDSGGVVGTSRRRIGSHHANPTVIMLDPHDIDVGDEEIVGGTGGGGEEVKLQYNPRLWS